MAVIRVEKNSNYTVMANYHLRDDMSLKAKGLMSLMLSLPDNWDYSEMGLVAICQESRGTIRTCLQELENKGYLVREQIRSEKGAFSDVEYTLHEEPLYKKPTSAEPTSAEPTSDNCTQLNKESIKERNNKDTKRSKRETHLYGEYQKVKLTDDEFNKLKDEYPLSHMVIIQYLDEYKEMNGKSYKNDYLAIKKWVINACKEKNLIKDVKIEKIPESVTRVMKKVNDDFNDF